MFFFSSEPHELKCIKCIAQGQSTLWIQVQGSAVRTRAYMLLEHMDNGNLHSKVRNLC